MTSNGGLGGPGSGKKKAKADSWLRISRRHHQDRVTAHLSALEGMVLWQVRLIAGDAGELDPEFENDALVAAELLDPEEVVFELGRHPDYALEAVREAMARLYEVGLLIRAGDRVRVKNLRVYNARRFAAKAKSAAASPPQNRASSQKQELATPGRGEQNRTGETPPQSPPAGGAGERSSERAAEASEAARDLQGLLERGLPECQGLSSLRAKRPTKLAWPAWEEIVDRLGDVATVRSMLGFYLTRYQPHARERRDLRSWLVSACSIRRNLHVLERHWRDSLGEFPSSAPRRSAHEALGELFGWREKSVAAARRNEAQPPPPSDDVLEVCKSFGESGHYRITDPTADTRTRAILSAQFVRAWNDRAERGVRPPPERSRGDATTAASGSPQRLSTILGASS